MSKQSSHCKWYGTYLDECRPSTVRVKSASFRWMRTSCQARSSSRRPRGVATSASPAPKLIRTYSQVLCSSLNHFPFFLCVCPISTMYLECSGLEDDEAIVRPPCGQEEQSVRPGCPEAEAEVRRGTRLLQRQSDVTRAVKRSWKKRNKETENKFSSESHPTGHPN